MSKVKFYRGSTYDIKIMSINNNTEGTLLFNYETGETYMDMGFNGEYKRIPLNSLIILWQNPSPAEDFAMQSITLSRDDFDILEWYFAEDNTYASIITEKSMLGRGCDINQITLGLNKSFRQRQIRFNAQQNAYIIPDCYEEKDGTTSVANNKLIPLFVVGYKLNEKANI